MRRRLLFIFAGFLALTVVLLATIPWWLGTAVQIAGPSRGLTFSRYERLGYSRFVLHDVVVRRPGVTVKITRAEVDTPLLWGWRHLRKQSAVVVAGDWRVEVDRPTGGPRDPNAARGWMPLKARLHKIAAGLDQWLPRAVVGAGVVTFPGGEIGLAAAKWGNHTLDVDGFRHRALVAQATIRFADPDSIFVEARTMDGLLRTKLESKGENVAGEAALWDQPATLTARFASRGWLPADGSLQAKAWSIPAARLRLGDPYSAVKGAAQVEWKEGAFTADIAAASDPLEGKAAPPLNVTVRGRGTLTEFVVEALQINVPGVQAALNEPITIERNGQIRQGAARFTLQADLAKMPWISARGAVSGEASVTSGFAAAPVVEFSVAARDVAASEIDVRELQARGRLDWPTLRISEGVLVGGEGERLTWQGGWDFRRREVLAATLKGEVKRKSLARWLPKQPEFETVELDAEAAGAVGELPHKGKLRAAGVKFNGLNPVAVSATWRGRGPAFEEITAEMRAGEGRILLKGNVGAGAATLTELALWQGTEMRLKLASPAVAQWRPQWRIESLRLAGPEGYVAAALQWGEKGQIEVSAGRLDSGWWRDFVPKAGPAWTLTSLRAIGTWDRGPMEFSITTAAQVALSENRSAQVDLTARGDGKGLSVEVLRAAEMDTTVVDATGRIPVTITPTTATPVNIAPTGALVLDASVSPHSFFWQELAALSGVELKEPQLAAHLTGTWQRPEGKVTLRAARVAIDPKKVARPVPVIEALEIDVVGDKAGFTLGKCSVQVEGQAVRAQGRLPVADGRWTELFRDPLALAREGADLRLEVPDAEVAVFSRFLPSVLAPTGRFQADLQYRNGGVEGYLRLNDAASRPLGPLGVLQEITADIGLSGRKLALRGVSAKSGGQPLVLSGTMELPDNGPPRFDLTLRGENLPFVRQTGLLVRGDLDLKLQTPGGAPPRLSGNVRLRDSLFLSDVRAFLPSGGTTNPSRRPPYFAIETAPVNGWGLAVEVTGEEFLRLRTPVFVGVASARFRLTGTLGEPRAIGEVAINDGSIRMPFASFSVTQGAVRLTEADPYDPEVYLRGAGRRYGYDLTMEIEGRAAQPNIVLTSSPALDSEQVLLMVMTGAAPSNEINRTASQRVANIGLFLGQSLLTSLGSDAAEADRLSFSSGEKISRRGKETYDIEYKATDRWSVTGEYNEFDEYNAGLKWRVFGGKRPPEKKEHAKK